MTNLATANASAFEKDSNIEIAAIERVLKSSFDNANASALRTEHKLIDITSDTAADFDDKAEPCFDADHHVSLIDLAGPSAAAIVEFTDCRGVSFTDLFVLHKRENKWAISQKVWDSHTYV